jgi:hypothetical protein
MAQVVECLPTKCEALCSKPSTTKKKKKLYVTAIPFPREIKTHIHPKTYEGS